MNFLRLALIASLFAAAPTWAESLTGPQKNAVKSAERYLSTQGFSRDGLIHQLSSDSGEGYGVADATVAVDSLNIDWNKEAVKSAERYLNLRGFSCKGLIRQLSSRGGDRYTVSQATYGARQAGACEPPAAKAPETELVAETSNKRKGEPAAVSKSTTEEIPCEVKEKRITEQFYDKSDFYRTAVKSQQRKYESTQEYEKRIGAVSSGLAEKCFYIPVEVNYDQTSRSELSKYFVRVDYDPDLAAYIVDASIYGEPIVKIQQKISVNQYRSIASGIDDVIARKRFYNSIIGSPVGSEYMQLDDDKWRARILTLGYYDACYISMPKRVTINVPVSQAKKIGNNVGLAVLVKARDALKLNPNVLESCRAQAKISPVQYILFNSKDGRIIAEIPIQ